MKKAFACLLMMIMAAHVSAQNKSGVFNAKLLGIKWEILQNSYNNKQQFKSALTITNASGVTMPAGGWKMYFNMPRQIVPELVVGPLKIEHMNGDYFSLSPKADFKGLKAGEAIQITFVAGAWAINFTDAPIGFYYVEDSKSDLPVIIDNVTAVPSTKAQQFQRTPADAVAVSTPELVYKQNLLINDVLENDLPPIFPTPVSFQKNGATFLLNANTPVKAAIIFTKEASYLKGELATVLKSPAAHGLSGIGRSILLKEKQGMPSEAYELEVNANEIVISASSNTGIFYGIQSLKSMLPAKAWLHKMPAIKVPGITVADAPRFGYRGLMLDVARNFHARTQVLKLLDLMGMYKLNMLHFHLNDDEGWRIEIPALPELTLVGAKRGHTFTNTDHLQPAYGSGPNVNNEAGSGFYTKADFIEILKYANERHIAVIPEIESPGHARAAIKSMDARYNRLLKEGNEAEARRYLLRDLSDQSAYSSVQHWNDNVVDVSLPSTYNFIETITDEVVKMYQEAGAPLKTIHFGGDEVPAGVWAKSPSVQKLMATIPNELKSTDDLWYYYFKRVDEILKKRNLYVSGWEEAGLRKVVVNGAKKQIPNPDFAAGNFHLYVWNNVLGWGAEDLAYQLANAGYPVILSCVSNLYFDMAYQKHFDEPGFYWGGYLDVDKPFKFIPYDYLKNITENSLGAPVAADAWSKKQKLTDLGKANILGIQGQLWSETVKSPQRMEYMILPKLLGLAERAWAKDPEWATNPDTALSSRLYNEAYTKFCNVLGKKELPRLSYVNKGYQYRIPTAGAIKETNGLKANVQFPGFVIRYTTDGTEPTLASAMYKQPLTAKGTYKFRVFNTAGRGGRSVTVIN